MPSCAHASIRYGRPSLHDSLVPPDVDDLVVDSLNEVRAELRAIGPQIGPARPANDLPFQSDAPICIAYRLRVRSKISDTAGSALQSLGTRSLIGEVTRDPSQRTSLGLQRSSGLADLVVVCPRRPR